MQPIFDLIGKCADANTLVPVILDCAIKGMIVLLFANATTAAMRRASAAARHVVWALSLTILCLLPVLAATMPGLGLPILPRSFGRAQLPSREFGVEILGPYGIKVVPEDVLLGQNGLPSPAVTGKYPRTNMPESAASLFNTWTLILWAVGVSIAISQIIVSQFGVWRRRCRSTPITDGAWVVLAHDLAKQYGIRRQVVLRRDDDGLIPATWGSWRPVVLVPAEALAWPTERVRAVLLHELAHIARCDFLVQTIARVACALNWFNPMVWYAARHLRQEAEQAADDLVLRAGLTPSGYATHLIEVLMESQQEQQIACSALTMVRRSEVEDRVRAILDEERSRAGLSRRDITRMVLIAVCFLSSFAFVHLEARAHDVPKLERLPEGMTIEVIGLSTHGPGKTSWWGPDGKPLVAVPCDSSPKTVNNPGRVMREVVVQITGIPKDATLFWSTTNSNSRSTPTPRKDGKPAPELRRVIASFAPGVATCDVHFDLSFGEWTTERTVDGKRGGGISAGDKAFFFGKAHQTQEGTAIVVAHNILERDVRLVVIEQDGQVRLPTHSRKGSAGHIAGIDVEFDIPPSKIRELQLQSRPMGRYEIKNVALQPSHSN